MKRRRIGVRFSEVGREWRLPGLLYVNHLVLRESEEDLRVIRERFVEVCIRRSQSECI